MEITNADKIGQADADAVLSFLEPIVATLMTWRRFIALTVVLASLFAVVVVVLLPNQYEATARVLPPADSGSPLDGPYFGRNLGSAARLLGGSSSPDYTRYLSIL